MQTIQRAALQDKMENNLNLKLVEVLDPKQYDEFHLPGAMNVPLASGFEESIQQAIPDKNAEVVVYCSDAKCESSAKAARKMEQLGYEHVYRYQAGKKDWKEAGLPVR
ncbi:MAG: rhodanese-like domain-containing protein [Myxococcales bacterium]|jgi:rhodanese-related sulfurtransferase